MATAMLNPILNSIHGRTGNIVFYRRYGRICIRMHIIPRNPNTPAQNAVRRTFADAVKSWQSITQEERYKFSRKARNLNMSGYNLYISGYMKTRVSVKQDGLVKKATYKEVTSNSLQLRSYSAYKSIQRNILYNAVPEYNERL